MKVQMIVREHDDVTKTNSVVDIIEVPIDSNANKVPTMLQDNLTKFILEATEKLSDIDSISIHFSRE